MRELTLTDDLGTRRYRISPRAKGVLVEWYQDHRGTWTEVVNEHAREQILEAIALYAIGQPTLSTPKRCGRNPRFSWVELAVEGT